MPSLRDQFQRIKDGRTVKYDDFVYEVTFDGCGSYCHEVCDAFKTGICQGCIRCDFADKCHGRGCSSCPTRCVRRDDLQKWLEDVDGLELSTARCEKVFDDNLPFYVPQVKETTWGVQSGAFLYSLSRFLSVEKGVSWFYKKKDFRDAYRVCPGAKSVLHFYMRDTVLELIWSYQDGDWGGGRNFWEHLKDFGFDAVISPNFSCFANFPRMEHHINIKRNVYSASRLAGVGIPVILDLMWHSDGDLDRLLRWGIDNNIRWFAINFQTLRKSAWTMKLVMRSLDKILETVSGAKILVNGVLDYNRVRNLHARYGTSVSVSNCAFVQVVSGFALNPASGKWEKSGREKEAVWHDVVSLYNDL